jgi:hypothetical protein
VVSVELLGSTGLRYREAGRQMFIDSEVLTGPSAVAVYKDTIQNWDPPYEKVPVTDSDRDRILSNIRDAFRSQGFAIDVIRYAFLTGLFGGDFATESRLTSCSVFRQTASNPTIR